MATIDAMVLAGCTAEQVAAVVRVHAAVDAAKVAERRAKATERKRRERSRDVTRTERDEVRHGVTERDTPPPKEIPHTPKEITPSPVSIQSDAGARKAAFGNFWQRWPSKVAKQAAEAAFGKVWREADAIMGGVDRYVASKPGDRDWMHAATFLNGRRWEDAPILPPARAGPRVNGYPAKPTSLGILQEMSREQPTDLGFDFEQGPGSSDQIIDGTAVEVPFGDGRDRGEA